MVVGFGRKPPKGHLVVFSTETEEQAKELIEFTCPTSLRGEHVAPELVQHQTIDNLFLFSDRLQRGWEKLRAKDSPARTKKGCRKK